MGYPLEEWIKDFYPEPINSAGVDFYYFATNTTAIRRVITGKYVFLEPIVIKLLIISFFRRFNINETVLTFNPIRKIIFIIIT